MSYNTGDCTKRSTLWDRVKDRKRRLDAVLAAKTAAGKRNAGGHGSRYLFSGLMRCACGASFVMKDKVPYACAGFVSGHTCDNSIRVQRSLLEDRLLTTIRDRLLSDSSIKEFTARLRRRLMSRPTDANAARRTELQSQVDNMVAAIGQGMISPALRQRLQEAEADLAQLPGPPTVVRMDDAMKRIPEAMARYRQMVSSLGDASIDLERAREVVRGLLGEITIVPRDGYLVAQMGLEVVQPILASNRGSGGLLPIQAIPLLRKTSVGLSIT